MTKKNNKAETRNYPEWMDLRVDWAFKRIFGQKKHLQKIIKDLLDINIDVIEYDPNELIVDSPIDKRSVFDVICRNKDTEEVFVLEMQNTYESDMPDRLFYYGGSLIHNQVHVGDEVYVVKSVLVCCIAGYYVPHNTSVPKGKVFFDYRMRESETGEVFDGDKLRICFLELNRFEQYLDKDYDLKKQWCWIFNNLSIFAERPTNLDSSFDDLIEDARIQKLTSMDRKDYMEALQISDRDRKVIYEGGIIVGKQQGREEKGLEIALNLISMGLSNADISKATGLSEPDIDKLRTTQQS